MTAINGRTTEAAAGAGVPGCSALVPVTAALAVPPWAELLGMVACGLPAVVRVAGRCPCGHARDGWLCEPHAALARQGGCRACLELEAGAHDCPLAVELVTGGAP
jgi:hypothetical protein